METVRENKVFLMEILSADASIVLQYVQNHKLITRRDYNNLNQPNLTQEKIIINLLDVMMNRGDETCQKFLKLLEKEEFQENFPQLEKLFTPDQTSYEQPSPDTRSPAKVTNEIGEYKMSSKPRGFCLIINNMDFGDPKKYRFGSDKDEESLTKVFKKLGFDVVVRRNQTAQQMKDVLWKYSRTQHDGDCFVCCILSHGSKHGVEGTDGCLVSGADIYDPFNGIFCPSLINKPKVFFIQACRGTWYHQPVNVQADGYKEEKAGEEEEEEEEENVEADVMENTIPAEADFLVARSTVKGYYSFRNSSNSSSGPGSWFIQSLCKQMDEYCPVGEDICSILYKVNEEVGEKVGYHTGGTKVKQMPVQKTTLRKKLVFRMPQ